MRGRANQWRRLRSAASGEQCREAAAKRVAMKRLHRNLNAKTVPRPYSPPTLWCHKACRSPRLSSRKGKVHRDRSRQNYKERAEAPSKIVAQMVKCSCGDKRARSPIPSERFENAFIIGPSRALSISSYRSAVQMRWRRVGGRT